MQWHKAKVSNMQKNGLSLENKHNPNIYIYVVGYFNFSHNKWFFAEMEMYEKNYNLEPTHFSPISPIPIDELSRAEE